MSAQHVVVGLCVLAALVYAVFRLEAMWRRIRNGASACVSCPASVCSGASGCAGRGQLLSALPPGQSPVRLVRQDQGNP
jgi:hypothetical protein